MSWSRRCLGLAGLIVAAAVLLEPPAAWAAPTAKDGVSGPAGKAARGARAARKAATTKPAKAAKPRKAADSAPAALSETRELEAHLKAFSPEAMRRAIADLAATFPQRYGRPDELLRRLAEHEKRLPDILAGLAKGDPAAVAAGRNILAFQGEVLLANPLLDFGKLLVVRRKGDVSRGLPANWVGDCSLPRTGFDNELAVLTPIRPDGALATVYRPDNGSFVGDVDLHWDAGRMLFSQVGRNGKWQVHEVSLDGKGLREVTGGPIAEYDNYDPAYTADDRILFVSNAVCHGVPCIGGKGPVGNMFRMNADGSGVRQLCFDQDHNWYPAMMSDGSVLYTRWEYGDTPHYFSRLLFRMNPDGTGQMEFYGSNSFWPNSIFYARELPGRPRQVAAVISGHHGEKRMGELVIFDTAKGRHEADGVVQRIPGWGKKVEPVIADRLVAGVYPRFLTPWPLSDKYFLVSCQLAPNMPWGIYLADVFDDLTLVKSLPGEALLEPFPLCRRARPPVIPDRVDLERKDGIVYLLDVYRGPGLAGVPRGTVKKLRLFEFHYAYNNTGGHIAIGVESGWDVKRIVGTVPVEPDGSAAFRVPANRPLAVQPLDDRGEALAIMRSWFTAMPGELLSCVGCHERQSDTPPAARAAAMAMRRPPSEIEPWHGPARGLSFPRDVQPALDRYCVGCHDGKDKGRPNFAAADSPDAPARARGTAGFTRSYLALHPFVRRPGPEGDIHLQAPCEWRANTSELVQMLRKGHHDVRPDAEAWDRLLTWIDLNVPDYGTWTEQRGGNAIATREARLALRMLYANVAEDPEGIPQAPPKPSFIRPTATPEPDRSVPAVAGWPFGPAEAAARQAAAGLPARRRVDLGDGVVLELALVPPGQFVMGDPAGAPDERPVCAVPVEKPFWIGRTEITNAQYGRFDSAHDSRFIDQQWKDHCTPGYPANLPDQPVIRVSWQEATAFCRWLAERTGEPFTLPTEAQWEYAARAGTNTAFSYGTAEDDFSKFANVADASIRLLAVSGVNPKPVKNAPPTMDFTPRDARFDDGQPIVCEVGRFQPNAWGLLDAHGNVAEWTRSLHRPYPYRDDERNDPAATGDRVVRGGSWYDRPARCRSAFRLAYPPWQKVFNVGFRVLCPAKGG